MISQEEARARVARGAAHLDVVRPGWFNRIDVGTLTVSDCYGCVLAQTYGMNYGRAADLCGVDMDFDSTKPVAAVTHGFHYEGEDKFGMPLLQDAWIEAIADRRLATQPTVADLPSAVMVSR